MCFRRILWGQGPHIFYSDTRVMMRRTCSDFARHLVAQHYDLAIPLEFRDKDKTERTTRRMLGENKNRESHGRNVLSGSAAEDSHVDYRTVSQGKEIQDNLNTSNNKSSGSGRDNHRGLLQGAQQLQQQQQGRQELVDSVDGDGAEEGSAGGESGGMLTHPQHAHSNNNNNINNKNNNGSIRTASSSTSLSHNLHRTAHHPRTNGNISLPHLRQHTHTGAGVGGSGHGMNHTNRTHTSQKDYSGSTTIKEERNTNSSITSHAQNLQIQSQSPTDTGPTGMHVRGRPVRVVLYSRGSSGHGRSMQVNRTEYCITRQKRRGEFRGEE